MASAGQFDVRRERIIPLEANGGSCAGDREIVGTKERIRSCERHVSRECLFHRNNRKRPREEPNSRGGCGDGDGGNHRGDCHSALGHFHLAAAHPILLRYAWRFRWIVARETCIAKAGGAAGDRV